MLLLPLPSLEQSTPCTVLQPGVLGLMMRTALGFRAEALPPVALKGRRRCFSPPPTSPPDKPCRVQCGKFHLLSGGGREQGRRHFGLFPRGLSSLGRFPPHSTSFCWGDFFLAPVPALASHPLRLVFDPLCPPLKSTALHAPAREKKEAKRMKWKRKWSQP